MSFVANAAITAAVINAGLAAFVLYTNHRSPLNRVYALWGGSVALWNFAAFFKSFDGVTAEQAKIWVGIIQAAVIFLPMTLAHLCQIILHNRTPRWIYGFYVLHFGLLLSLIFTPYYMKDVQKVSVLGWWSVAGPLFKVYLLSYVALTFPLLFGLPGHARRSKPVRKAQLLVLWFSILTLWLSGTNDMMPIVGRTVYPGTEIPFFPLGNFGAIFYGLAVAYSVLQHQLLDIYTAFSRVTSVLLRVSFVVGISMLLLFVASGVMPGRFDARELQVAVAVIAFSTLIGTVLFPKLLAQPIERFERKIRGDRFELPDKVRAFIEQMKWQYDLSTLLDELAKFLAGTFRLRGFSVVLLGETRREFSVVRSHPATPPRVLPNLQNDGSIFSEPYDANGGFIIIQDTPPSGEFDPQEKLRHEIKGIDGRVVFPFRVEAEPLGFLMIGDKQNGGRITADEARLLTEIAQNLSFVVHQISLKNQIARAQELDLIGRMSQGMAHDLRNLITPISTLIQLIEEETPVELLRRELLPPAKRNMETMRAYIRESLFFTGSMRAETMPMRLDIVVDEVIADARVAKRKGRNIRFESEICGEVYATLDAVLIQRLLKNLINNAIDASSDGGLVRVDLERLKMDKGREWVRIQVADFGSGIEPTVMKRMFEPYFSTKKTGDDERGFGLGLAICKKIATLHEGSLTVESEVGKGTTFFLDLPCRPADKNESRPLVLGNPVKVA